MKFVLSLLYISSLFSIHHESSYPYNSGYTWWHFCDWKLTNPDYGKKTYSTFDPAQVELGDTLFVEYNCLEKFAAEYLPLLKDKVILITGNYGYNGDMPVPGPYGFILESDKVAAWFVQNIDRAPTEKLIPMPIGLASNYWPHGDDLLIDCILPKALQNGERPILLYANFSVSPNRIPCANYCTLMGVKQETRKSYAEYLEDLCRSVFVLSPPGGGLDCHRTWEALLFGCYPIVLSNTLNPLYEDLPVLIVQDWYELTPEYLEEKLAEFKKKHWSRDKLYFPYWEQKVHNLQQKLKGL